MWSVYLGQLIWFITLCNLFNAKQPVLSKTGHKNFVHLELKRSDHGIGIMFVFKTLKCKWTDLKLFVWVRCGVATLWLWLQLSLFYMPKVIEISNFIVVCFVFTVMMFTFALLAWWEHKQDKLLLSTLYLLHFCTACSTLIPLSLLKLRPVQFIWSYQGSS